MSKVLQIIHLLCVMNSELHDSLSDSVAQCLLCISINKYHVFHTDILVHYEYFLADHASKV